MRARTISRWLAVLACLGGAIAISGRAGGQNVRICETDGARVLLRSGAGVVARRHGVLYGCAAENGKTSEIDEPGDGVDVSLPPAMALRGRFVAFTQAISDFNGNAVEVVVRDLREYDPSRSIGEVSFPPDGRNVVVAEEVGSMVVSSRGSFAWITCPERNDIDAQISASCRRPGLKDIVYRYDIATKRVVRVALGKDIYPNSLRRAGALIVWRQGRRRVTAPMT